MTTYSPDESTSERLALFEELLSAVNDSVMAFGVAGLRYMNSSAERLTGRAMADAYGKPLMEVFNLVEQAPLSADRLVAGAWARGMLESAEGIRIRVDYRVLNDTAENRTSSAIIVVARETIGSQLSHLPSRRRTERSEPESVATGIKVGSEANLMLNAIAEAVINTDFRGRITYLNRAAQEMCHWNPADTAGFPIDQVVRLRHVETGMSLPCPTVHAIINGATAVTVGPCILISRLGREVAVEASASPILDEAGGVTGAIMVVHDVTRSRELSHRLAHLASHDSLTGLPNRALFSERLEQTIAAAARQQSELAVMFIDLDNFKQINDSHGHLAGDQVLKEIAGRLRRMLRSSDLVCRYGGDEFAVLLTGGRAPEAAEAFARRMIGEIQLPITIGEDVIAASASIGVAHYPYEAEDGATLLKFADQSMYRAKRSGTGVASAGSD